MLYSQSVCYYIARKCYESLCYIYAYYLELLLLNKTTIIEDASSLFKV